MHLIWAMTIPVGASLGQRLVIDIASQVNRGAWRRNGQRVLRAVGLAGLGRDRSPTWRRHGPARPGSKRRKESAGLTRVRILEKFQPSTRGARNGKS